MPTVEYNNIMEVSCLQTIGERIKIRREQLGLSQDELAKKLGYKSRSSVNKIETDSRNLTQSKIKAIADALETTPSYIMGWEEETPSGPMPLPPEAVPYNPTRRIPLLGRVAAGTPIYAEENIEGWVWTDRNHGAEYFALRVRGDSMNAANIKDGDIVLVRKQEFVEDNEIAVVLIDDSATIKRYRCLGDTVILTPQSTNPENQTQFYQINEHSIHILGKVVESRTEF